VLLLSFPAEQTVIDGDDFYNNRGFVYNNKGEYDRAIVDLDKAIQLNPKSARAYKNRGISYEKKGEFQKALSDYNLAISLDSHLQEAIEGAKRVSQTLAMWSPPEKVGQVPQKGPSPPSEPPPRIVGADLFIDLALYVQRPVVLTDGRVIGASNQSAQIAQIKTGGVTFWMSGEGIDRESFRFFLHNCSGFGMDSRCKIPLLVTPTGEKGFLGYPIVKDVKMVQ